MHRVVLQMFGSNGLPVSFTSEPFDPEQAQHVLSESLDLGHADSGYIIDARNEVVYGEPLESHLEMRV